MGQWGGATQPTWSLGPRLPHTLLWDGDAVQPAKMGFSRCSWRSRVTGGPTARSVTWAAGRARVRGPWVCLQFARWDGAGGAHRGDPLGRGKYPFLHEQLPVQLDQELEAWQARKPSSREVRPRPLQAAPPGCWGHCQRSHQGFPPRIFHYISEHGTAW